MRVGRPAPVAPFLARPEYCPLLRPYDPPRAAPMPVPPASLPGVVAFPPIARVATRLGLTLREVDERLSVDDVLDEVALSAYLYDVDNEPRPPETKR